MCRNIRLLHHFKPPTTPDEIHAASLQYVRKVSGMREPSKDAVAAFEKAVAQVAAATARLLEHLPEHGEPHTREGEKAKAKEKWSKREAQMRRIFGTD